MSSKYKNALHWATRENIYCSACVTIGNKNDTLPAKGLMCFVYKLKWTIIEQDISVRKHQVSCLLA